MSSILAKLVSIPVRKFTSGNSVPLCRPVCFGSIICSIMPAAADSSYKDLDWACSCCTVLWTGSSSTELMAALGRRSHGLTDSHYRLCFLLENFFVCQIREPLSQHWQFRCCRHTYSQNLFLLYALRRTFCCHFPHVNYVLNWDLPVTLLFE